MLKHIYKTFLIAILSCSLMTLDISHQGIHFSNIQAETLKTDGVKDNNLMATLTMTAIGVLTQRLWKCKLTTDMMVAAAGGAAFIGGEILAYIKLKKVMKDMETEIKRDKNGKIEQAQIDSLKQLRASYEEAKKTAGTKKTLMMAAAAAFAAAGVLAYTSAGAEMAADKTCQGGLTTAAAGCAKQAAAEASSMYLAWKSATTAAGGTAATINAAVKEADDLTSMMIAPSIGMQAKELAMHTKARASETAMAAKCQVAAPAIPTCEAARALEIANRGVCAVPPGVASVPNYFPGAQHYKAYAELQSQHSSQSRIFEIMADMFFPQAKANLFSPMGIASSAAISFLLATSATLGTKIDNFLFVPTNRAIVWGVLAGLTFMASSAVDNVIGKIDSNIAKIDAIINYMNVPTGVTAVAPEASKPTVVAKKPDTQTINGPGDGAEDVDVSSLPGGKLPCFTGDGKEQCKSFEEQMTKDPSYTTMSPQAQGMMKSIAQTADGFNGKSRITRGTITEAGKLAGTSNAVRAALTKSKKDYADKFAKQKKKIDLDGREKAFADDIEASVRAQLKKSNMSAAGMLGSMYGGSIPTSDDESATAVAATDESTKASDGQPIDAGVIDIGGASAIAGADFGGAPEGSETSKPTYMAIKGAGAKGTTIDDYDLKNDITKDKDTSLFDLISNRYQKSGYPRLFRRVK